MSESDLDDYFPSSSGSETLEYDALCWGWLEGEGYENIDLKDAAKFFSHKFSCGSSVTGDDEIVIQGDVKDDLFDIITEQWPEIDEDVIDVLGDQSR
ncbi:Density-regulated [Araneus ventricosus]|uniref:Density-regulated n=1 Tax=Araneus ventricosus TaxID=182803 RepID=A0A4Y2D3G4_ARAVE|nr:Density-regulated [Araneus ventricosus]